MKSQLRRFVLILIWIGFCGFDIWPFGCSSTKDNVIVFTPVGASFGSANLVDLEFLPGQSGQSIVIQKNGVVSYLTSGFEPLAQTFTLGVLDEDEQGLLAVVADPDYASNRLIYLYYTIPTGEGNRLDRFTVNVDVTAGSFTLIDQQNVATFLKTESPNFDGHHNGGGMVFGPDGDIFVGVGDGGGDATEHAALEIPQDDTKVLGKIHRIVPNRVPGAGGVQISEIYAKGLRNPFSLAQGFVNTRSVVFIGDVGSTEFEEIDLLTEEGQNFGWPLAEGSAEDDDLGFADPIHGYKHTDNKFAKEDPEEGEFDVTEEDVENPLSVIVGTYYTGDQYGDELKGRLIYTDFFQGWVRGFKVNEKNEKSDDKHLGHQSGITSIQQGPDGFLYAVSLFGSDHILRIDIAPED